MEHTAAQKKATKSTRTTKEAELLAARRKEKERGKQDVFAEGAAIAAAAAAAEVEKKEKNAQVDKAKEDPPRIVFVKGEDKQVMEAARALAEDGLITPWLLGDPFRIEATCSDVRSTT